MRVTVVGSGTAAPHPDRVCAGYWVEAGESRVLFDCGNGVVHRLASLGIPWADVTHVALTHFHYDHVGDLPALIAALRWGQLPPRAQPLTIAGPVGAKGWLERFAEVTGDWLLKPGTFEVTVVEMEPTLDFAFRTSHFALSCFPTPHTPESIAYSIVSGRARLVYTGDTGYDDAVADWAAGCDVLLTECSLPAALAIPEHLSPESAGAFAARAHPGRLVLSHFFPPVEREDILAIVAARYAGPVVLAHDGTTFDIQE
jgi:ribonuclease BN (tRNA processing enzyme)